MGRTKKRDSKAEDDHVDSDDDGRSAVDISYASLGVAKSSAQHRKGRG